MVQGFEPTPRFLGRDDYGGFAPPLPTSCVGVLGLRFLAARLILDFQRHQPGQQRGGIELADHRQDVDQAARHRVHGCDIARSCRGERAETHIQNIAGERWTICDRKPAKGAGDNEGQQSEQARKGPADRKIKEHGSYDPVIGDASRGKNRFRDNPHQSEAYHQPGRGLKINIQGEQSLQPETPPP